MSASVLLRTEVVHRYVFELRYDFGQTYWDRAGRICREIAASEPWDQGPVTVDGCRLSQQEQNLVFNFGPKKLDLVQTQNADVPTLMPVATFATTAEKLTDIVIRRLDVNSFPRIGFRAWHLYPTRDREESHQHMQSLAVSGSLMQVATKLGRGFEVSHSIVIERPKHLLRLSIAPFEQQVELPQSVTRTARQDTRTLPRHQRQAMMDRLRAEKAIRSFPAFGIMLDIDAFVDDPPYPDGMSISDFINSASIDAAAIKQSILQVT